MTTILEKRKKKDFNNSFVKLPNQSRSNQGTSQWQNGLTVMCLNSETLFAKTDNLLSHSSSFICRF